MLIFYDLETTGLAPEHDQIMQISAIQTDNECVETGQYFHCRVRLGVDRIPSPELLLLHGTHIEEYANLNALDRVQAVEYFRDWLQRMIGETPETVLLGWNSRRFDDAFMRHESFRGLHRPFHTSKAGRQDAMRMVQFCDWLLGENVSPIQVPFVTPKRGKPYRSFSLGALTEANGIEHKEPHTAGGDVKAMVDLCRKVAEGESSEWAGQVRFGNRDAVLEWLRANPVFIDVDMAFGRVTPVAATVINDDLMNDYPLLLMKLNNPVLPIGDVNDKNLPVRYVNVTSPMFLPYSSREYIAHPELPEEAEAKSRADEVRRDASYRTFLRGYWEGRSMKRKGPVPQNIGASLDWSPVTFDHHEMMADFHERGADALPDMKDDRIRRLAARACLETEEVAPEDALPILEAARDEVRAEMLARSEDGNGKDAPLCIAAALQRIEGLLSEDREAPEKEILRGYSRWLHRRRDNLNAGGIIL